MTESRKPPTDNADPYREAPPSPPVKFRRPLAEEDLEFDMEVYRSNIRLDRADRVRRVIDVVASLFGFALLVGMLFIVIWAAFGGR